ncbi:STAS domain-containing protein [Planctomycetota bacterium]|nr:STAS domain-containing protein [Planctomycetota bacterium]
MPDVDIPSSFNAVVLTAPPVLTKETIPGFLEMLNADDIQNISGDRIFHFHQVEDVDSAAVAELVTVVNKVARRGQKMVICEPPPIVRSLLKLYGLSDALKDMLLSSSQDGTYNSPLIPFVPPFVPEPVGRLDIYREGKVQSFKFGGSKLIEMEPVNLSDHPSKARTRANSMIVHDEDDHKEIKSIGYVLLRDHACGCDHTHAKFDSIYNLHGWYRKKGFDFLDLKLWASDKPAGHIVEEITFRSPDHFQQFSTMLKIDESWKKIMPEGSPDDEFYYVYF